MKKVYLKVEFGSRGEMVVEGLVESSIDIIRDELDEIVENCEDEEEVEYYEEFMYVEEKDDRGIILVGVSEELCYDYIDYEMNREKVDRILEIDKLCEEGKLNWNEGENEINDIIYSIEG